MAGKQTHISLVKRLGYKLTLIIYALTLVVSSVFLTTGHSKAIISGDIPGAYPWAVSFVSTGSQPIASRIRCSGTLIKSNWVITAAHCSLPQSTTQVVIGRGNLASSSGAVRSIAEYVFHPNYNNGADNSYDLLLLRLSSSVTLDDMDLADPGNVSEWDEGSDVRAYGYGRYDNNLDEASQYLRRHEFEIQAFLSDHRQMTTSWSGRTACNGDSGGPVITSTSEGPKQVGVIVRVQMEDPAWYEQFGDCILGGINWSTKVGYRGSPTSSPMYYWIQSII